VRGGELAEKQPEGMQELMMQLGSESFKIGETLGYPIVPISGLISQEIEGSNNLFMKLVDKVNRDIGPGRAPTRRCKTISKADSVKSTSSMVSWFKKAANAAFPLPRMKRSLKPQAYLRRRIETRPFESQNRHGLAEIEDEPRVGGA
jgi:hypothetical protein